MIDFKTVKDIQNFLVEQYRKFGEITNSNFYKPITIVHQLESIETELGGYPACIFYTVVDDGRGPDCIDFILEGRWIDENHIVISREEAFNRLQKVKREK